MYERSNLTTLFVTLFRFFVELALHVLPPSCEDRPRSEPIAEYLGLDYAKGRNVTIGAQRTGLRKERCMCNCDDVRLEDSLRVLVVVW